ncbi:hypothetical protein HID58_010865 [Brassica napus]|uniref:NUC153 domain-containing protein n=1 Tax=Brassica napus TaxID=3708 RepID=A0ABQ8DWK6_BRANA|nr:hypothetical protein HID58_010865 [Brassica napus]
MKQKDDDDDDDDDDSKKKKGLEEKVAAEERSIAELELIGADENGGDGSKGLKGYNIIKGKGREMAEEKIPWADPDDDSRFSAAISDHNYTLDPANPRFKRVFFFSAKTKNLINDAASRSLLRYQHSCSEFPHLSFVIDQVARASAFGLGLIYGNVKLKALKIKKNSQIKAEAKAHQ